jgi:hypothetical protein
LINLMNKTAVKSLFLLSTCSEIRIFPWRARSRPCECAWDRARALDPPARSYNLLGRFARRRAQVGRSIAIQTWEMA